MYKIKLSLFILFLFSLFVFFPGVDAKAQNSNAFGFENNPLGDSVDEENELRNKLLKEDKVAPDDLAPEDSFLTDQSYLMDPPPYVETTMQNVARLYWRFDLLDINNDEDVDNFLLYTECDTYKKLHRHDFVWEGLRAQIREHLKENKHRFSNRLSFTIPILLDRYNFERGGFPISEESKFDAVKRMRITDNSPYKRMCLLRSYVDGYPQNVVLVLKRPVFINFVEVQQEVGKMYMEYLHERAKIAVHIEGRVAYLKVNTTAHHYMETKKGYQGQYDAVFFGEVDSYELYADPALFLLMGKGKIE